MANRRNGSKQALEELEAAIEETSEEREDRSQASRSRRGGGRRAERAAHVEEQRRRKLMRWALISAGIAAIVVVASLGLWWFLQPEGNPIVVVETTKGTFEIEIYTDECPITAGNFEKLVKDDFYDGLTFHRIMKDFMIQGGDPNGDGTGGPGYTIEAEQSALDLKHDFGALSMANSGSPDTAGSQFFIVNKQDGVHNLDGDYAVFGKVVKGMDVVMEISNVPVTDNGQGEQSRPLTTIYMEKVYIKEG